MLAHSTLCQAKRLLKPRLTHTTVPAQAGQSVHVFSGAPALPCSLAYCCFSQLTSRTASQPASYTSPHPPAAVQYAVAVELRSSFALITPRKHSAAAGWLGDRVAVCG